ncbi:TRAP transporter small permease [Planococcus shenhongbingii]|uniref:TRAP transporter small permease n=1 Tax=Planococcus shenhongbingii TaxID=3058398 RepID=A0ABT8NBD9_9BACL|nr:MULTISPECIES: TRAP transporter small permease [unclassified Planococcus (in: firmicutes)]MDN7244987.1 TRAP transporter small permease [Planococcus sp. N017]WKA58086.1 TRAP transporter small permease [Planococcus sp. N016]
MKVLKILDLIESAFSSLFFLAGIGISLYSVFMRYVLGNSQSWATEIYTMLLVWAIFIGFSTALKENKHIAIDLLYDKSGPKFRRFSQTVTLLVGLFFSIFIFWTGMDMVMVAYDQQIKTIDLGFPIWINYLIMPLAGFLLFIRFCEKAYRYFVKKEDETGGDDILWKQ